jgi:hypothetical protein
MASIFLTRRPYSIALLRQVSPSTRKDRRLAGLPGELDLLAFLPGDRTVSYTPKRLDSVFMRYRAPLTKPEWRFVMKRVSIRHLCKRRGKGRQVELVPLKLVFSNSDTPTLTFFYYGTRANNYMLSMTAGDTRCN